jgi:dTDP-4-amino-4,6-dideoxygalactose transaminase
MSAARVALSEADIQAALGTLAGGWLTMGPRIQALEAGVAERFGVAHAIAVSSGTTALHLACVAAGVQDGASAVVSALAGPSAVNGPRYAGGRPLPADIADVTDPVLTAEAAAAAADAGTKAVIASHLAGVPADAEALRAAADERGWVLIEDVTDALGATLASGRPAGTAGHLGCFSLSPGRIVGVGEGGLVLSDDDALAARVRSLRSHAMTSVTWDRHRGHAESYDIVDIGFNFRMDEPRAAIAGTKLERLDELVAGRRALADAARDAATGVRLAWSDARLAGAAPQAVALVLDDPADRDGLIARLGERGLQAGPWPDAWQGAPQPPVAADARARSVLVDLGAAEGEGLAPAALAAAIAAALGA